MAKIVRPYPRRPAWWYPVGTRLTLRDGRQFEVILHRWAYEWRKIENGGSQ